MKVKVTRTSYGRMTDMYVIYYREITDGHLAAGFARYPHNAFAPALWESLSPIRLRRGESIEIEAWIVPTTQND